MTVCWVKWFDASYHEGPDFVAGLNPGVVVESAGVLVSQDNEHITIVGDWWPAYPSPRCRHIHHIPKVNVIEMRTIEQSEMKKRRIRK